MSGLRSNADLALMALGLGTVSLAYASGAFVMGLALYPLHQRGWNGIEILAVGLYPLGWVGLAWATVAVCGRWRRRRRA